MTVISPASSVSRQIAALGALCLAALTLALALLLPAPASAQRSAARDWSQTVTLGANGAFVVGNPAAPTKLVEYLSYTCSHCADFQATGTPALKAQWIRRGLVSLELRNFVRDPFDLTAALLARCGGATRFVGNHEAMFADYQAWMTRAQSFAQAQEGKPPAANRAAQLTAIAEGTGLGPLLARRGLTSAAQGKCLADEAMLKTVLGLTSSAGTIKEFTGTPFFLLNGKPLENVHTWDALRPLLPPLPASGK
ncbi:MULTISPECIES: DsbA family protein [unclassified Sphingobium]|uniref:DsbA family protein n=1 Tax=unclassified Sphingobium TaxID=2611147 RepID=UPI002224A01C|nr:MULTISPECIES: DsbA family protein [unclassified Sphingobium]MCW2395389.1 protein-disulfide isomerase [Sphingobium sp. B8D3B]MCW2418904.1 protein-disulfide isomerase [Sphingobium sp. B8D3C]